MKTTRPMALTALMTTAALVAALPSPALAEPPAEMVLDYDHPDLDRVEVTNVFALKERGRKWRYSARFEAFNASAQSVSGSCRLVYDTRRERTKLTFKGKGRPGLKGSVILNAVSGHALRSRVKLLHAPRGASRFFSLPDARPLGAGQGTTDPDPDPKPKPAASLQLEAGSYWVFRWERELDGYSGARPYWGDSSGVATAVLGRPERHVVAGQYADAYPVSTTTREQTHSGTDITPFEVPGWTHLATIDGALYGSGNGGQSFIMLFHPGGKWTGLTLFEQPDADPGLITTTAGTSSVHDYSVDALLASRSYSVSDRDCVNVPGTGAVCSGSNTGASMNRTEFVKAGMGTVGLSYRGGSHSDDGGVTGASKRFETRVVLVSTSFRGTDGWQPTGDWGFAAPLPSARFDHTAVALGGRIYTIGGIDDDWNELSSLDAFDPATRKWTSLSGMSQVAGRTTAAVLNGLIYATDGISLEAYDPATDRWTTLADAPELTSTNPRTGEVSSDPIEGPYCAAVAGRLRVFSTGLNILDYDPQTDTWARLEYPGLSIFGAGGTGMLGYGSAATFGGNVYVVDHAGVYGYDDQETSSDPFDHLSEPAGWAARFGTSLAAGSQGLYLTGGYDENEDVKAAGYHCLPSLGLSIGLPEQFVGHADHASVVLGDKLYLLGGWDFEGRLTNTVSTLDVE